jgi:hypothetical protein
MKHYHIFLLLFVGIGSGAFGQSKRQTLKGKVSFVTSKNIYVKFENTDPISIGDTLRIATKKIPCLVVTSKSSSSVVCSIITDCEASKNDEVFYNYTPKKEMVQTTTTKEVLKDTILTAIIKKPKKEVSIKNRPEIKGRLSVADYSTFSSIRDDRHRLVSRFSLYANHISNLPLSFDTYATYRQDLSSKNTTSFDKNGILNIYNLAVQYDIVPTLTVVAGRKINQKMSSIGAIDGLQVEKSFGTNYVGVIGGFRPDFFDYGFNSDLFEYGVYLGKKTNFKNFYSQTTAGFIEQRNNNAIDRRYAYFQHSSTIFKKLSLFSSLELDLYDKINNVVGNRLRLTNLYTSIRYRFSRQLNVSLSYDARKRIVYYETFQTEVERLLNDDITRQGIRARINIRPFDFINTGFSYSKRFQSDNQNKSDNIYVYFGITKLPGIGGRLSLNYNINSSNYLESNIVSLRHSRTFMRNRLNADFYYRFVNYSYLNSNNALPNDKITQNYFGTNLSFNITKKLTLSVSGELSTSSTENNYRFYTRLIKRFYSKKRKK